MVLQQTVPFFELVVFIAEWTPYIVACCVVMFGIVRKPLRMFVVITPLSVMLGLIILCVWESNKFAVEEGYDMSQPTLRAALEEYIVTGEGDVDQMVNGKKFPPVFGKVEMNRYLRTFLFGSMFHDTAQDADYLPEAYNKGDDWFEATLGEPMVYTGAIYAGPDDTQWEAQLNKLDFITHALGVRPGDQAMDIGCGWGRLANHLASKGANVTGVTMSSDQKVYAERMTAKLGNKNKVHVVLENFFDVQMAPKSFNVISSVEMAEHVGIKNYGKFLAKVHDLLADDGTFYIQVAGLQRGYAKGYNNYEDLVWGMFMDEHVFPGADASCPMGWVVTQLERAGFEVQSVANLGNHYARTIAHWLQNWEAKKDAIVKAYGIRSWRRWRVFLTWSIRIAKRGGSTVQFITVTKSGHEGARKAVQDRMFPGKFQLPEKSACPGGGPASTE